MQKVKRLTGDRELIRATMPFLLIALLFILSSLIFSQHQESILKAASSRQLEGMLIYTLVFTLSIVLTPISAVPLIPTGAGVWGVVPAALLSLAGWSIGAFLAFEIARRFGRPLVERLVRKEDIEWLEKRIPRSNIFWSIFILRAVTPFDGLSYALGLLPGISRRTYYWATVLGLLPFCLIASYFGSLPVWYMAAGFSLMILLFLAGCSMISRRGSTGKNRSANGNGMPPEMKKV